VNFALQHKNSRWQQKKNKVVQESSRQRSNKRDNMSQMLLGMSVAILAHPVLIEPLKGQAS